MQCLWWQPGSCVVTLHVDMVLSHCLSLIVIDSNSTRIYSLLPALFSVCHLCYYIKANCFAKGHPAIFFSFFFLSKTFPPLGAHGAYCGPQLQCSISVSSIGSEACIFLENITIQILYTVLLCYSSNLYWIYAWLQVPIPKTMYTSTNLSPRPEQLKFLFWWCIRCLLY